MLKKMNKQQIVLYQKFYRLSSLFLQIIPATVVSVSTALTFWQPLTPSILWGSYSSSFWAIIFLSDTTSFLFAWVYLLWSSQHIFIERTKQLMMMVWQFCWVTWLSGSTQGITKLYFALKDGNASYWRSMAHYTVNVNRD